MVVLAFTLLLEIEKLMISLLILDLSARDWKGIGFRI